MEAVKRRESEIIKQIFNLQSQVRTEEINNLDYAISLLNLVKEIYKPSKELYGDGTAYEEATSFLGVVEEGLLPRTIDPLKFAIAATVVDDLYFTDFFLRKSLPEDHKYFIDCNDYRDIETIEQTPSHLIAISGNLFAIQPLLEMGRLDKNSLNFRGESASSIIIRDNFDFFKENAHYFNSDEISLENKHLLKISFEKGISFIRDLANCIKIKNLNFDEIYRSFSSATSEIPREDRSFNTLFYLFLMRNLEKDHDLFPAYKTEIKYLIDNCCLSIMARDDLEKEEVKSLLTTINKSAEFGILDKDQFAALKGEIIFKFIRNGILDMADLISDSAEIFPQAHLSTLATPEGAGIYIPTTPLMVPAGQLGRLFSPVRRGEAASLGDMPGLSLDGGTSATPPDGPSGTVAAGSSGTVSAGPAGVFHY